jgi:hypothetical protein
MGGVGFYTDWSSGLHLHRNLFYNNGWAGILLGGTYRDGDEVITNNTIINSYVGINLCNGYDSDKHNHVKTIITNNIIANTESWAIYSNENPVQSGYSASTPNTGKPYYSNSLKDFTFNNNLYYKTSYKTNTPRILTVETDEAFGWEIDLETLSEIKSLGLANLDSQSIDDQVNNDTVFTVYSPSSFTRSFSEWPKQDFYLKSGSLAINQGTTLPQSTLDLLAKFKITDNSSGIIDIGAYEYAENAHCSPLGDIDCSGKVNALDLAYLISKWGGVDAKANLDNLGSVDALDLKLLLGNWGKLTS